MSGKYMRVSSIGFWISLLVAVMTYQYFNSPLEPCNYNLPSPPTLDGPLTPNNYLSSTTQLLSGYLHEHCGRTGPDCALRPESFASSGNGFFTGLGDGTILHISTDETGNIKKVESVLRTGKPKNSSLCGLPEYEVECGRPLGMQVHPITKKLISCDTQGLLEIDTKLKTVNVLIPRTELLFCNDVEITKDGEEVYITDSSTKYSRAQVLTLVVNACPTGRILKYNFESKKTEIIFENLFFPNGIIIDEKNNNLLVSELQLARILKIPLEEKRYKLSILVENLPGLPDNLQIINNQLFIGLSSIRKSPFSALDFLSDKSWLRRIIFSLISPTSIPLPEYGIIVSVDLKNGNIISSFQDPTGKISRISEIHKEGNFLYLGSWFNDYLGQIPLPKI